MMTISKADLATLGKEAHMLKAMLKRTVQQDLLQPYQELVAANTGGCPESDSSGTVEPQLRPPRK